MINTIIIGRAALSSSLSCYKFMMLFAQVSCLNQVINAYLGITFSPWTWVTIDGFFMMLSFFIALSRPAGNLCDVRSEKKAAPYLLLFCCVSFLLCFVMLWFCCNTLGYFDRPLFFLYVRSPPSSLLGSYTLGSCIGIAVMHALSILAALLMLRGEDWYQCRAWDKDSSDLRAQNNIVDNYESSVVFLVSGFQYLISAMICNLGYKHRAPWYKNFLLVFVLCVYTLQHMWILFIPGTWSCQFRVNCEESFNDSFFYVSSLLCSLCTDSLSLSIPLPLLCKTVLLLFDGPPS